MKQLWIGYVFFRFGTGGLQELVEAEEFAAEGASGARRLVSCQGVRTQICPQAVVEERFSASLPDPVGTSSTVPS